MADLKRKSKTEAATAVQKAEAALTAYLPQYEELYRDNKTADRATERYARLRNAVLEAQAETVGEVLTQILVLERDYAPEDFPSVLAADIIRSIKGLGARQG